MDEAAHQIARAINDTFSSSLYFANDKEVVQLLKRIVQEIYKKEYWKITIKESIPKQHWNIHIKVGNKNIDGQIQFNTGKE